MLTMQITLLWPITGSSMKFTGSTRDLSRSPSKHKGMCIYFVRTFPPYFSFYSRPAITRKGHWLRQTGHVVQRLFTFLYLPSRVEDGGGGERSLTYLVYKCIWKKYIFYLCGRNSWGRGIGVGGEQGRNRGSSKIYYENFFEMTIVHDFLFMYF